MKFARRSPGDSAGTPGTTLSQRRGFVLLVVTIVVILLSLAAWSYMNRMMVEQEATMMYGRDIEARMAAESAIEYAAIQIGQLQTEQTQDVFHNPTLFRGQVMTEADNPRGQCRFTILTPNELSSTKGSSVRFGLARETARFNINRLTEFDGDDDETTSPYGAIAYIPGMTEEIANAIMDWIDSDEERRVGGAESADYQGLAIPYSARNSPMESIDELMQVQGITPILFYGEDANRNGMLDPNEDDGNESLPDDNADGILDAGWREYFTVSSKERNTTSTGDRKININGTILTELFDEIEEAFDTETATFIIAYRLWGNENADPATVKSLTVDQKELSQAIAGGLTSQEGISITRNGMNLNQVAAYSFRSIYDVIDAQVEAEINGAQQSLNSPWTSGNLVEKMPEFEDRFTHIDDAFLDGRINVNIARREVLLAIPDMTETIADTIVTMRPPIEDSGLASAVMTARSSPTWLLGEGVIDLNTLRRLGPWLTTGGDIFTFQALGHFDQGGPATRLEAKIDATQTPPRIIFQRDLTPLGRGFHPSVLSSQ